MAKLDADGFIELISQLMVKEKVLSLGVIDPNYTSGKPKIVFDGSEVVSSKAYPYLASYTPAKNDRVLLANIAGSVVILGRVI